MHFFWGDCYYEKVLLTSFFLIFLPPALECQSSYTDNFRFNGNSTSITDFKESNMLKDTSEKYQVSNSSLIEFEDSTINLKIEDHISQSEEDHFFLTSFERFSTEKKGFK